MDKTLKIIRISLLSVIAILLLTVMIFIAVNDDFSFIDGGGQVEIKEENIIKNKSYSIDNIKDINFEFISSNVYIKLVPEDSMKVIQYSNKSQKSRKVFEDKVTNETITIKESNKVRFFIGFNFKSDIYVIELPQKFAEQLNVKTVSSDISVDNALNLKKLNFQTVSGDILINGESIVDDFRIKTTSGDIDISSVKGNSNIKTISGDIEIDNIDGRITLATTSGDIEIDNFNITEDSSFKTVSGDVNLSLTINSNYEIRYKTVSGDIKVPNNSYVHGTSPYNIINIKTTSGDIKVK